MASFPDGRADSFSSCWFSAGSEAKHLVNSLALARDDDSRVCGRNASEWLQGSKLMAKHLEQYSTRPEYGGSPRGALFGGWRLICLRVVALLFVLLMCLGAFAYSVLTHEEIVDLLWTDEIRPLLLKRFPALTQEQITEAHAYAYGGAVIQDLGYYPFGGREFSDLIHYVRSGDFVRELILDSQDANEYAFALGALAHYSSDIAGHPAVNRAVAMQYPKLRARFGKLRQVRARQDRTFENGVRIRHGAGREESLCVSAIPRFYRI